MTYGKRAIDKPAHFWPHPSSLSLSNHPIPCCVCARLRGFWPSGQFMHVFCSSLVQSATWSAERLVVVLGQRAELGTSSLQPWALPQGGGDQVLKMKEMEEPPARAWSARARAQVLSFKIHFIDTSHLAPEARMKVPPVRPERREER